MALEMPKNFDFDALEKDIYETWENAGLFKSKIDPNKKSYTIVIPPPNVTGVLHMGHALNNTLQDILIRYHRMLGFETLWQPGTDHAGIATQSVVENVLYKEEGKSRYDVGREALIEKIWTWKEKYGGTIVRQLRTLGCSCDWSRERFTMDEGLSKSVNEVFCTLFERGLIYRGSRITNRCPKLGTSLADDEIEYKTIKGHLWTFRYFTADKSAHIDIATTRPETMLGDVAVAINKDDKRWNHLLGKTVVLPCNGKEIPVIADDYVDPAFGTGAVKITPAHDPNDYEVGLRHNLDQIVIMNNDGTINELGGKYAGMYRFKCRKEIVKDLEAAGHLIKIQDHENNVGHCYRTDDIIEPIISKQWFVKMKPLAIKARQATDEGKVNFHPARWEKFYLSWIDNVRDWCISRQIWWGHRIPVWYCSQCDVETISRQNAPECCSGCGSKDLQQDPDVLDTWFSSALWPFSTIGWPDNKEELDYYYPTATLSTDRGIIFFWVARMVMMGMEFLGKEPFKDVYIHGTILDEQGRKMSKSLGNGIDPLEMIGKYGADAVRFSLIMLTTEGQDLKLALSRFEMGRNFTNKVWNAARFVLMSLDKCRPLENWDAKDLSNLSDKWIISKLNKVIVDVGNLLKEFKFNQALTEAYSFLWDDFCDWYLESVKSRILEGDQIAASILHHCLTNTMKLLHPFVPFVTEQIWSEVGDLLGNKSSLMIEAWPEPLQSNYPETIEQFDTLKGIVGIIRNVKATYNVPTKKSIALVLIASEDEAFLKSVEDNKKLIKELAFVEEFKKVASSEIPSEASRSILSDKGEVIIPLNDLIDKETEIKKLKKQLEDSEKRAASISNKLSNESFTAKAPVDIVDREKNNLKELNDSISKIKQQIISFGGKV